MTAAPAACDEVLQILGGGIELVRKSLQVLRFEPIVLYRQKTESQSQGSVEHFSDTATPTDSD